MTSALHFTTPLLSSDFPLPLDRPFTTRDAVAAGIPPPVLTRLCRHGLLRRVLKGVYIATQIPDDLTQRARALALVVPSDAVVTDRTAGWLFGAQTQAPGDHLQLPSVSMFRLRGHTRLRNELCRSGQRTLAPEDITVVGGVRVTSPVRTAWDLGRLLPRDHAIASLDALLRLGVFDKPELLDGVERFRRQRGVVQLRELAPLADGRAESPAESVMRLRWLDCGGLPRPEPQVPVLNSRGIEVYRIDLGVPELRFGVEYDGQEWHDSEEARAHDKERRSILARTYRWEMRVLTKVNLYGAEQNACAIFHEGVLAARRSLGRRRL